MCGIVGAIAQRNVTPVLLEGLRRLEYRGYDSCGVAVLQDGEPLTRNAHPIFSSGEIALVHNGIIENHESLRETLSALGRDGNYLASDTMALAGNAEHFIYLEEGDLVSLSREGISIADRDGNPVAREIRELEATKAAVGLGPYRHYMQKEIFEQPSVIADSTEHLVRFAPALFGAHANAVFAEIDSVLILACGTSYHSGMTAKYWLESISRLPTSVEIASEYRYRDSVPNPRTLVLAISQSGETADTLAALKHAQVLGHRHTLAVCNVAGSAILRQAALHFLTRAGAEIGVASTKAFTTQLVALFVLAATLAKRRGMLDAHREAAMLGQLHHLPAALNGVLALAPQIIAWAGSLARKENALFLGRGIHYPIALEGALKLKEISYIHAEAYAAGELKHGPLALVTEQMPVVTVAPNDALLEKLKSNLQEVRARGGELYVFSDADSKIRSAPGLHVIRMPEHYGLLSPILHVVPLQLLAYHTACARGTDVDKPRDLAKSVTVE
ncbi:glutamine--fructose-6-phosphate transaminase (isomerizing) [Cupriavidus basilensis]|uniref:Glutamine--fructose-6-phosphate aminotransferase [isomerizing] n=1 Tax=Cupriavidus basilensis TaxID=68895 RepID=A0A0C4Y2L1_9BURK|nr:glutamine--fructose-6-phosphate transaminase (isomerizing) [Cupriavidus basilensis]AJG19387.1 Glucosamine--fructose-6-phosphate aminotransferase [isomerizing] [Cupriavidus basilensis]